MERLIVLASAGLLAATIPLAASTTELVLCAPGYPGSTAEAQPSLDAFARVAAEAAGWKVGGLSAVYHETERGGLAAIAEPDAALALVAWPFFDKYASTLRLVPIAHAVRKGSGADEAWSLVAKKERIKKAEQLAGWEIFSLAGYAPDFVRERALAPWGTLPASVRITAGGQVLSALRRAASGDDIALLLDGTQTAALASLPFAADLEVVAASEKVPVAVLCTVETRMPPARARAFADSLGRLHESPEGAAVLEDLRLVRFVPAPAPAQARTPKTGGAAR